MRAAVATQRRLAGPGASVRKYDVLTLLAMAGLRDDEAAGALSTVLALRLIALITARYNWALDEASVGHEELARLWNVSRRTVIRDLEKLRVAGFLAQSRPARRGRVAAYRLGHDRLTAISQNLRSQMHPDLAGRLVADHEPPATPSNVVVAFRAAETPQSASLRTRLRAALSQTMPEPALMRWFDPLRCENDAGSVVLTATSCFHADYVERTFGDRLRRAASGLGIAQLCVRVG